MNYILKVSCTDHPGLMAKVTGLLFQNGRNIMEAQQFNDRETGLFFMRVAFESQADIQTLQEKFEPLVKEYGMTWRMHSAEHKQRVLLLVSKFDHCLGDLLYRARIGELKMDVVGVVSNHSREVLKNSILGDIPFYHLPITRETKPQ